MASWIPFTFENAFPSEVAELSNQISNIATVVSQSLQALSEVLKITGALISGYTDALAATLNALIESIRNSLLDLLSAGFYITWHVPTSLQSCRTFAQWTKDIANSFDDIMDSNRPQFTDDAYVGGLCIVVAAPSALEVLKLISDFTKLILDWDIKYPELELIDPDGRDAVNISDYLSGSSGQKPDWNRGGLIDVCKPFGELLIKLVNFLGQITAVDSINDNINAFADFISKKGQDLASFAQELSDILDRLLAALGMSGLYVLPIIGQGGNSLLKSALISRTGDPANIQSSSEKGAQKAQNALQEMYNKTSSLPDQSKFMDPKNRDAPLTYTMDAKLQAEDRLRQLQNDLRKNNSGSSIHNGTAMATAYQAMGIDEDTTLSEFVTKPLSSETITETKVKSISYDKDGKKVVEYQTDIKGQRFAPTGQPTFANMNNYAAGLMIVNGGPSEDNAIALFNLFGVSMEAGQVGEVGVLNAVENMRQIDNIFNNYGN